MHGDISDKLPTLWSKIASKIVAYGLKQTSVEVRNYLSMFDNEIKEGARFERNFDKIPWITSLFQGMSKCWHWCWFRYWWKPYLWKRLSISDPRGSKFKKISYCTLAWVVLDRGMIFLVTLHSFFTTGRELHQRSFGREEEILVRLQIAGLPGSCVCGLHERDQILFHHIQRRRVLDGLAFESHRNLLQVVLHNERGISQNIRTHLDFLWEIRLPDEKSTRAKLRLRQCPSFGIGTVVMKIFPKTATRVGRLWFICTWIVLGSSARNALWI